MCQSFISIYHAAFKKTLIDIDIIWYIIVDIEHVHIMWESCKRISICLEIVLGSIRESVGVPGIPGDAHLLYSILNVAQREFSNSITRTYTSFKLA